MEVIIDRFGMPIRLTDERLVHILDHPEMADLKDSISGTLKRPELVVKSNSDESARLYYRFYSGTRMGDKFVCVVVKIRPGDAFVLTAYLTDKPKQGVALWNANT